MVCWLLYLLVKVSPICKTKPSLLVTEACSSCILDDIIHQCLTSFQWHHRMPVRFGSTTLWVTGDRAISLHSRRSISLLHLTFSRCLWLQLIQLTLSTFTDKWFLGLAAFTVTCCSHSKVKRSEIYRIYHSIQITYFILSDMVKFKTSVKMQEMVVSASVFYRLWVFGAKHISGLSTVAQKRY